MRWKHIKELVEADLLQANRQMSNNRRAQSMEKRNIYWRILLQNGAMILLFAFLFGSIIFNLALAEYPGIFTETISFVIVFSALQVFQLIYSLFYDDVDLSAYLSLPFSLNELFSAKIITIFFSTIAYFIMPLILISILGIQTEHSFLLAIPIALFSTLLIMSVTILAIFLLLQLLHQWSFFRKHKKIFMIFVYILFFGLIFTNIYQDDTAGAVPGAGIVDSEINSLFVGFYHIFIPGNRLLGWLQHGLWFVGALTLVLLTYKWVIPKLYFEEEQPLPSKKDEEQKQKNKQPTRLSSNSKGLVFMKYQLRQITDTTLILQMLFAKFYLPIIMIAPTLFNDEMIDFSILETIPHLWGSYLVIGAAIGFIMITETSISGVIISFDKENYNYIKSLPLSFRGYLKAKFNFAFFIEWILGASAIFAIMIYLGAGIVPIIILLFGYTATTYASSLYYYMRDYRLLNLAWDNFSELMQRGLGQVARIFTQLLIIILGLLATIGFLFWFITINEDSTRLFLSISILFLLLLLPFSLYKYAKNKFWTKFNL